MRIETIGTKETTFKLFNNLNGPNIVVSNSDLLFIGFNNNTRHEYSTGLSQQLSLGQYYQGGYIFYLDETGVHGLIAAPKELPGVYLWGKAHKKIGANSAHDGEHNTEVILKLGKEGSAAHQCANYNEGGYKDWYLPSIGELEKLQMNKNKVPFLDPVNGSKMPHVSYCSSTEHVNSNDCLLIRDFHYSGMRKLYNKHHKYHVYPIRKF